MAQFYKAPTTNFEATTLNGAIDTDDTTISLTDASNIQAPGVVVIDRQDGDGNNTPSAREVVAFTGKSSNDLTGCTRGFDNSTARTHADGALVETAPTVGMWNDLRDAVAAALSTDGTDLAITGTASIATAVIDDMTLDNVDANTIALASSASVVDVFGHTLGLTSVASIARAEVAYLENKQQAVTSVASIARGEITTLVATNVFGGLISASTISSAMINYTSSKPVFTSHASGFNAINFAAGKIHTRQLTANTTINFSNAVPGQSIMVRLLQDGTGSRTVNWDPGTSAAATILWTGGTAPTLTTTANKTDVYGLYVSNATLWNGFVVGVNI